MTGDKYKSLLGNNGLYELDTGSWRTFRPIMDKSKCIECGICLTFCPVFAIEGDKDKNYYITYGYCKGCGICAHECPHNAINMIPEKEAGE